MVLDGRVIHRYDAGGHLDTILAVPAMRPMSCCFGGPEGGTLWITTATQDLEPVQLTGESGLLLTYRAGVTGPAATRDLGSLNLHRSTL